MSSSNAEAQWRRYLRKLLSVCGCHSLSECGWVLGLLKGEGEVKLSLLQ